jgi:hypothetical protein
MSNIIQAKKPPLIIPFEGVHGQQIIGVKGEVKMILRDLMGRPVLETPWKPNLITNQGLINMNTYDGFGYYARLGSSSQAPAVTDTGCIALLGNMDSVRGNSNLVVNSSTIPYEVSQTVGHRFNAGTATGTIREMTVQGASSGNTNATSRFLVTPEINKTVDQILDTFWRFSFERYNGDIITTGVDVTEDGASVLYDVITRGVGYGSINPSTVYRQFGIYQNSWACVTASALGATVNDTVSGVTCSGIGLSYPGGVTQAGDTAYRDVSIFMQLDEGNVGGIRTVRMRHDHNYDVGHQFTDQLTGTTKIPKDNTKELSLTFRTTWARI